jgi:ABC-2 type transport system ATP-binding protein
MADRVGVINKGELILTERKSDLMHKLGQKQLAIELNEAIREVPAGLASYALTLSPEGRELVYTYDPDSRDGVRKLLEDVGRAGLHLKDLRTSQRSLEDIFVSLVRH